MATFLQSAFNPSRKPVSVVPDPPDPGGSTKNWNPGPYIASTTTDNDSIWSVTSTDAGRVGIIQRLSPAYDLLGRWKGALLRFAWPQLEGDTLGSYTAGINKIRSYLNQIAAYPGKRLIIFIQLKTFGATANSVPLYMRTNSIYNDSANRGNGQYAYASAIGGPGGFMPNIHVNSVRDRLIALMNAYATEFNDNPNLEAIVFGEASMGTQIVSPGTFSDLAWTNNMANAYAAFRPSWSNVQICQWINDRATSKPFVPLLRNIGVGLGMTDACDEDVGFHFRNDIPGFSTTNPGNIQHCQESNGLAIITGHCSMPALNGGASGRCQTQQTIQNQPKVFPNYPGAQKTRQAVRNFAVTTVGVTHLLIAHNTGFHPTASERDSAIPASCTASTNYIPTSDSISGAYAGKRVNLVTDNWINNPSSVVDIPAPRPTGWN